MTPHERLWAAIRLEKPDRVPIVPTLLAEPAAGLCHLTQARIASDNDAVVDAAFRVFDEHGGWKNPYPAAATPIQLQAAGIYPMRVRIPGRDLPDDMPFQLDEAEILTPHDYDPITEQGYERFYYDDYLGRVSELDASRLEKELAGLAAGFARFGAECARRGTRPFFAAHALHPFFSLSLMRSLVPFTQDLHFAPEPIERALRRMTNDLIAKQLPLAKQSGIGIWLLTEERASGAIYPPRVFERFWWPYTREIVDAFWSEGIVTLFHLDTCWERNLGYFRELPRGSAILEFDGTTSLRAARDALGGHLCLKGDVPAALLSVGTPDGVERYVRALVDEIGSAGGFILGSGCSVPPDVRPENFAAMLRAARRLS